MKIAILGTRGIPNEYGGFEQFAEYLSTGLVDRGHQVAVYNPSWHSYQKEFFKGVEIIKKHCPEKTIGSLAHFLYDWICSKDAKKRGFDVIYHAGYLSAGPSIFFLSKKSDVCWVTNMDGLEWKRDKWNKPVKWLAKQMEKIVVRHSNYIISDNIGIQKYYKEKFKTNSTFLPYGAAIPEYVSDQFIEEFKLKINQYYILVARLEPENSIETILDGFCESKSKTPFVVVGRNNSRYGEFLKRKYYSNDKIIFVGGVYNIDKLNSLRKYAKLYFHGHTVGGTNPSLLEAMALGASIVAHNNIFNFSVLDTLGDYFSSKDDIIKIINKRVNEKKKILNKEMCIKKIKEKYNWNKIICDHENFFYRIKDKNPITLK